MNPCLIAVVLAIVDSGQIAVVVECVDVMLTYASHLPHRCVRAAHGVRVSSIFCV